MFTPIKKILVGGCFNSIYKLPKGLKRFHTLIVGRELKMVELKKEIEKLKEELDKTKGQKSKKQ